MKHLKNKAILLLLLSFVCINVNAWYIKYATINDNTEVKVVGIVLEAIKHDFGYIIREETIDEVKTVEIPSFRDGLPVTIIGNGAFRGCYNLVSVTLPSNLKKIDKSAFSGCRSLPSFTIPNSVTSIGTSAFYGCSGLTSIEVESGNTRYDSRNNCNAIIESSTNTLICGCKNTTIPNSVTSIGTSAFSDCSGLTSVTIPNSVTSIGDNAFYGCSGLTSITIPNSVTSIGESAFEGCSDLTSVTIPNSVTSIGSYAFRSCKRLASVHINDLEAWINISFGTGHAQLLTDKTSNPLYMARHLYMNNEEITNLVIPNSVSRINDYSFTNCLSFNSVSTPENLDYLGKKAFADCDNLTSVTIGNGLKRIEYKAFADCDNLTSATIGSIKEVQDSVFSDCKSLSSVTFENGFRRIGPGMFYNCSNLASVVLPASLVYANSRGAFKGCTNLLSVTSLNDNPSRLGYITYVGTDCIIWNSYNIFSDATYDFGTLYVPVGAKEKYLSTEEWNYFKTIVEGVPSGIESVEEGHAEELGRYLLDGTKVEDPQKGLNIIKYNDGSTKKVMVK